MKMCMWIIIIIIIIINFCTFIARQIIYKMPMGNYIFKAAMLSNKHLLVMAFVRFCGLLEELFL